MLFRSANKEREMRRVDGSYEPEPDSQSVKELSIKNLAELPGSSKWKTREIRSRL